MSSTSTTIKLPDYSDLSVEENIKKASVEIGALTLAEKMTSERTWEVAALASAATAKQGEIGRGRDRTQESLVLSIAEYADRSGWTASGRNPGSLQMMVATYRKWKDIGRVEGCGFWTHYEFRNKPTELLPNTSYNEAKAERSEGSAEAMIQSALAVVPAKTAIPVVAEYLDTEEAGEVLAEDENAAERVLSAASRSVSRGTTTRTRDKRMEEATVVLELIAVLGKLRDLASTDPQSGLLAEAKNLMRETLRILEGIETASPEVVGEMISDLEDFLSSQ